MPFTRVIKSNSVLDPGPGAELDTGTSAIDDPPTVFVAAFPDVCIRVALEGGHGLETVQYLYTFHSCNGAALA
jgi:hypothetical protein